MPICQHVAAALLGPFRGFTESKSADNENGQRAEEMFVFGKGQSEQNLRDAPNSTRRPSQHQYFDHSSRLSEKSLRRIFSFVCPHSNDFSLLRSEHVNLGNGCATCDTQDLANCARVCQRWYHPSQEQLYTSLRIDAVHYCEREDILAEKRRRKSSRKREDGPTIHLQQLATTLRCSPWLGSYVRYLKLPYTLRESNRGDLARVVNACSNLQYVDLPEEFFAGDQKWHDLRLEMQTHCPNLIWMKYTSGSEAAFQSLAEGQWRSIEVLELADLEIDSATLRITLSSLWKLQELKITALACFDDDIFLPSLQVPSIPPLRTLTLADCPAITIAGLLNYMDRIEVCNKLTHLSLSHTGVAVHQLPDALQAAISLQQLSIQQVAATPLPFEPLHPLASRTLRTLRYEITPPDHFTGNNLPKPSDSYYTYLASSLLANSLPALELLYVRDPTFPESLLLTPPSPEFAQGQLSTRNGHNKRWSTVSLITPSDDTISLKSPKRGLYQPLQVYTRGLSDDDWMFSRVAHHDHRPTASTHRSSRPSTPLTTPPVPPVPEAYKKDNNIGFDFFLRPSSRPTSSYLRPDSAHTVRPSSAGGMSITPIEASQIQDRIDASLISPMKIPNDWAREARRSLVVGDGAGGFLAVPQSEPAYLQESWRNSDSMHRSSNFNSRSRSRDAGSINNGKGDKNNDGHKRASWWGGRRTDSAEDAGREHRASRMDMWR